MTLTEFLLARIAEDEAAAFDHYLSHEDGASVEGAPCVTCGVPYPCLTRRRVLRECEAKRRIVERHKSWPVLVQTPPELSSSNADPANFTMRMTQRIQWLTQEEYRRRFGEEPPTAPIIAELAAVYSDHPDYQQEWKP